ncbi:MAG: hypothetical protein IJR88_05295 [Clostridia bacterium]|nr:hypothetical protein [Clostridia bacterium]
MKKIRVLFPYVESGFGHIMPMRSIVETFQKKYGDRVEVIAPNFYADSGVKSLVRFEQMMAGQVRLYNANPVIGYIVNILGEIGGSHLSSLFSIRMIAPRAYRAGIKHMDELAPDAVFSTHWATNYYAEHCKKKPLTVMYCPDARMNKLFKYRCDLNMISMPYGYEKALRKRKYNIHNLKYVPFLIRNEAFDVCRDKKELRKKLGIPEDNFTVVLVEGGYGIGKITAITKLLIKEHRPLTVISICGKNEKLYRQFRELTPTDEVTFLPKQFAENILELEAASDLFCGKSGNMVAEATFFGVPSIITNCTTTIEHNIADHYINTVGCAIKEFSPKKVVRFIERFSDDPAILEPYRKAAENYHPHFGSEQAADVLWEKLQKTFPELR